MGNRDDENFRDVKSEHNAKRESLEDQEAMSIVTGRASFWSDHNPLQSGVNLCFEGIGGRKTLFGIPLQRFAVVALSR